MRRLDLNTVQRHSLELVLMDDEKTTVHVKMPTRNLFREMQAMASTLDKVEEGDADSTAMLYDFIARALSCNRERLTILPDEIETKYRMEMEDVLLIFSEYVSFITEVTSAKN